MTAETGWPAVHAEASQLLSALVGELCGPVQHGGRHKGGPVDAPAARAKLHRLARVARTGGLASFASIVLRLGERIEPCLRAGAFAPRDLEQFSCVAAHCGRYLDDPTDMRAAAALVEALGAEPDPAAGRWERNQLLQGVVEEATELIRNVGAAPNAGGHDGLTGLFDRDALRARLQEMLTAADASSLSVAVMAIGIGGVEDIVDSLGPQVATAVVASAARALICAVPCGQVVARLGTDHFVVVRTGLSALELSEEAARLVEIICRSRRLGGHLVSVTARIGLAVAGQHGDSAADLLANADAALHDARARRVHTSQFFAPHMRQAALRRVSLEARLRTAIERGGFELHYQPKLTLRTGRLCGLEALIRWPCGAHGYIPPAEFIPMAEESGLIIPLGDWVLDAVCRQIALWRRECALEVPTAINLSAVQLCSRQTHERIGRALQRHEVPAQRLEVEITESALMRDAGAALRCLSELGRLGVRVAIDDFGTGYSNLSQLMRLPLAAIKIDKSLIAGIATHARDAATMRAIVDIARTLGARVVAEGVENLQQRDLLAAAGCDEYQGYLLAMPMDAQRLQAWITHHGHRAPVA